jgi:UTP:GlnB (protein PII) uridylyltransferase
MSRELATAAAMHSEPEAALDRVRPVYRAALHDAGASRRLTDCLVGGLFHFASVTADSEAPSMAAPIACVATGSYAAGRPEADAGLLLVIEERGELRGRGERVAGLLAYMLGELEVGLRTTVQAPADCALRAEALPSFRRSLAQRRFLRGRYALFEALGRAIEPPRFASRKVA